MSRIRVGLIGIGIMGSTHLKTLLAQPENYEVAALCDTDPEKLKIPEASGIPHFSDYRQLLESGLCEAVGVATPHPCHAEIAIAAFRKGLHVLCEKPLAETIAKTEALLAAAEKSGKIFSTNFSMRTTAVNQVIRDWLKTKRLGEILRVDFVCTEWIRSRRYYDMQSWRGTWRGEGGGLLMNQAPHNLDLLFWWFGEMESVRARLGIRLHDIETEDEVEATFVNRSGFPIRFYANTGEAPGRDFIEIVGDRGTLIREAGKLYFKKLDTPVSELLAGDAAFPEFKTETAEVPVPEKTRGVEIIWRNFADAIRDEDELIAPGQEAIHAVEFANAMMLSHFKNELVALPVNRVEYDNLLNDLIQHRRTLKK